MFMKLLNFLTSFLVIISLTTACGSTVQPPQGQPMHPQTAQNGPPAVQQPNPLGSVTISFDLRRMKRRASDQVAVWIEDVQGKHIKTLMVTKFTAVGGYEKRPQSLLNWQKSFQPSPSKKQVLDALSTATPQSGHLSYTWDCRDLAGQAVPAGQYVYKVEANIEWENIALWQETISIGKDAGHFPAVSVGSDSLILKNVKADFKPAS